MNKPILLVEDNEHDVFFLERAVKKAGLEMPLQVARDGQEALDYLSGTGRFADRGKFPLPCLVLLDLKLPQVDGIEVLRWIRSHPKLQTTIVVMLTSSHLDVDVHQAYRVGANSFLVKTASSEELSRLVRLVHDYWLNLNRPPPEDMREYNGAKV